MLGKMIELFPKDVLNLEEIKIVLDHLNSLSSFYLCIYLQNFEDKDKPDVVISFAKHIIHQVEVNGGFEPGAKTPTGSC